MNIFYNFREKQWQSDCKNPLLFGKNLLPIQYGTFFSGPRFSVKSQGNKIGPLIGILTSKEGRKDFYGNRTTFIKIQDFLQSHGGVSFVMTPEGYLEDKIEGYLYDDGEWRKAVFPLPDVIYNRVASYRAEKHLGTIKKMALKNAIPLYNPHFFQKWETFLHLNENQLLSSYLPVTEPLNHLEQLVHWIEKHDSVFLKPVLSNRGNGIYLLKKLGDCYEVKSNDWSKSLERIEDVWEIIKGHISKQKYIIQKRIKLKQLDGRPYDLRVLVQRQVDTWQMTGIGVRLARFGAITTHVPKGGEIIPFETVNQQLSLEEIKFLALQIAHQLELVYGYLCEFSFDLGIDENNQLWIFEVNSKPMKFDEAHIQEKALSTLIECFYGDAGFTHTEE